MRPGEGGGRNRVAAQLVLQPGRGVTSRRSPAPGRLGEARLASEKMLTYANHLGLYAEQISRAGEQQGNFPQALTHLALISAAFNLDRALGA
jgi:GH15 family glucan-1,4-alpha-glucosidase